MARGQPDFTSEEVEVLLGCVEGKRAVLFGTFGAGLSSVVKDRSWEEVAAAVSGVSGVKRSVGEVKKKWASIKSSAKGRAAVLSREMKKTGGGPSEVQLSSTEERVVGMLSNVVVDGISTGFDSADDMLLSLSRK